VEIVPENADMPAPDATPRLLMVGLDAVSLPYCQAHLDRLPVLAGVLREGVHRPLQSTARHLQATPWPTFNSASGPGHHGQYFPLQWVAAEQRFRRISDPQLSRSLEYEPFWYGLARAGVRTIAFDMACVLGDEHAPCLQITNWSYQSTGAAGTSNPGALQEIRRRFGRRPIGVEVPVAKTGAQSAALRDKLVRAASAKGDAALHLMQNHPWDLFLMGFYEAHRAGHNLWPIAEDFASATDMDAMLRVYEETDRQLGRLIAAARADGRCDVCVFALHGMAPNRAQDHFLAPILNRLSRAWRGEPVPPAAKPDATNLMAFLRHALPPGLQYHITQLAGERVQDFVVNRALTGGVDWAGTPSFGALTGGEGAIRLNVKGRERHGMLDPANGEVDAHAEWLIERLLEIRVNATGEPLVASVTRTDHAFPGPRRDLLPDLLIDWAPDRPATRISSPVIGTIEAHLATGRGGNHTGDAFAIVVGSADAMQAAEELEDIKDLGAFVTRLFAKLTGKARAA
jgi:predicted AlkP superfamily phosphohydrolase/phosphomutase